MFSGVSKKITLSNVQEIEAKLSIKLPEQLVKHYLRFNGGVPEKTFFYSEISDIETNVKLFVPLQYVNEEYTSCTLEDTYLDFIQRGIIPVKYLPFAYDWGGNVFCVDLKLGYVVIIWMDIGEVTENSIKLLANDFREFLDNLGDED